MKEELCKAFCGELSMRKVPVGYAVSTAFDGTDGDPIGFYIVGPDLQGKYRIEDNGVSVSFIEATGADLKNKTRKLAFDELLEEYGVEYYEDSGELTTLSLKEDQIPKAAIKFVALLLRVQDIVFMAAERAASTFRDDAMRMIKGKLEGRATIEEDAIVDPKLSDVTADVVIRAKGKPPVAVFFAMSDKKVSEAIFLHMVASYEAKVQCSVVVLMDKAKHISQKNRQRAANRLDAAPEFYGMEENAIDRITREVLGPEALH